MSPCRRKKSAASPVIATVESLSHDGRGVARVDGKAVFIAGALAGEEVSFLYSSKRRRFDEGYAVDILKPSPLRVAARCRHYAVCGGCSLMHLQPAEQIKHKQAVLLEQLAHLAASIPEQLLPPLTERHWGYRHKARLGVKHVLKKARVLVGFKEKHSRFITDMDACVVLHPKVGERIAELQTLIAGLSVYNQLAQIEIAVAENTTALILRHLQPLSTGDMVALRQFEEIHGLRFYLQPGGLDTIHPLSEPEPALHYTIDHGAITVGFRPQDFTQINFALNNKMIDRAIELLAPDKEDVVLDLFCGLGNFSLPLARYARHVFGLEGSRRLIQQARANADDNEITNIEFAISDLVQDTVDTVFDLSAVNKLLLDPPRSGARQVLQQLPLEHITMILYVSCNPATLARDADMLVNHSGYRLKKAGVVDMFPHTRHVESMALFVR